MERINPYFGTKEELLREIEEASSIVYSDTPQHEDPIEDIVIRGIWEKVLEQLLQQLQQLQQLESSEEQRLPGTLGNMA